MSDGSGPLTQAQALALVQRTTDPGWYAGMQESPDGQAILNALTYPLAEASQSVMDQVAACAIATAPAGRPGRCDLYLSRPIVTASATLPKGFIFVDSRGVQLAVQSDIAIAVGQAAIYVPLVTVRQLDLLNNTEPAFDDLLDPGDVADEIVAAENPPLLDSSGAALLPGMATYVSSTAIVGAEADWLSAHGQERGCYRQPGEDGEAYRLRVRAIPNAATPVAIQDAVHGAQAQSDLPTVFMVEPMRDQASDDARLAIDLIFADSLFFDEGFLDDPLGIDLPGKLPWRTCEMPSLREARAYFRLSIDGELLEPDGSVWYWDDGYLDDPVWGYPDVGMHPSVVAALRGIQESARVKVAGGVQFDTYVECVDRVDGIGEVVAAPLGTIAFSVTAASGTVWMLRDALITVTSGGAAVDPTTDAYMIYIVFADLTALASPWSSACDGMPLRLFELERLGYFSQQISQISIFVKSSVSSTLLAAGSFWFTTVTL